MTFSSGVVTNSFVVQAHAQQLSKLFSFLLLHTNKHSVTTNAEKLLLMLNLKNNKSIDTKIYHTLCIYITFSF